MGCKGSEVQILSSRPTLCLLLLFSFYLSKEKSRSHPKWPFPATPTRRQPSFLFGPFSFAKEKGLNRDTVLLWSCPKRTIEAPPQMAAATIFIRCGHTNPVSHFSLVLISKGRERTQAGTVLQKPSGKDGLRQVGPLRGERLREVRPEMDREGLRQVGRCQAGLRQATPWRKPIRPLLCSIPLISP